MTIHRNHLSVALASLFVSIAIPVLADEVITTSPEQTTTTTTVTTKHRYVYYADHDIYFAPETKVYYWQANGTWTSGVALPPENQTYIRTKGIEIELDTDKPYTKHEYVIAHYKHHDSDDH
jgi:hypothetical protein